MLNLYVGYDPREAAVFHVFNQSVIENASRPLRIIPLHEGMLDGFDGQRDGSNAFIYSRFLVPHLQDYQGWALFCDGDMLCANDVHELYELRDERYAVQVVKHDYQTRAPKKYLGTPLQTGNDNYPCKNWSSVVLWNCAHPSHQFLSPRNVAESTGAFLHRFEWLRPEEVGELPKEWNWLDLEYAPNPDYKLVHHTLGSPGFGNYQYSPTAKDWNTCLLNALNMEGERQVEMVRKAHWSKNGDHYQLRNPEDSDSRLSGTG